MFLDNKYTKEYYEIIRQNKIKNQQFSSANKIKKEFSYIEKHHIIPKSMGGSDSKENIVYLLAADHFKCHQLLVEMTEGLNKGKMWNGLWRMMNKQSRNQHREFTFTEEDYTRAKIAAAQNHRERFSGSNNQFYGKKHTAETLAKMSSAKKGKTYEDIFGEEYGKEMRKQRSKEQQGKIKGPQTITSCPHCNVVGGISIMKRWHGDRCRSYSNDVEVTDK